MMMVIMIVVVLIMIVLFSLISDVFFMLQVYFQVGFFSCLFLSICTSVVTVFDGIET